MCDDHDDPALAGDQAEVLHQFRRHDTVQAGIRLIQNKQGGRRHEFHTDRKSLLLSAGKLGNLFLFSAGKAKGREDRRDAFLFFLRRHILRQTHLRRIADRITDRVVLTHQVILRNESDPVLYLSIITVVIQVPFFNRRFCLFITGDGIDKRTLACTGASEDQNHVTRFYGEIDILQQGDLPHGLMGGSLIDVDGKPASLCRITVNQARSFEIELRITDLNAVINPDPDGVPHFCSVQQNLALIDLLQLPRAVFILQGNGAIAPVLPVSDHDRMAAVIHVDDLPVPAADKLFKENGRKHAVI